MNHLYPLEKYKSKKFDNGKRIKYSQKCNFSAYKNGEICIYAVSSEIGKFKRITYTNLQFFQNFFFRILFKIEYEHIVEIEVQYEAQEELEIDLEDLEYKFIIDEEESESDYDIADSCYESDSDIISHAEVTSRSIIRAEINTLDGNRICIINFYYLYTSNHSSDRDKFCSSCIIRMHDLFLRLHAVRQYVISQYTTVIKK